MPPCANKFAQARLGILPDVLDLWTKKQPTHPGPFMAQTVGSSNGSYSLWFPTSVSYMSISTIASFLKKINREFQQITESR